MKRNGMETGIIVPDAKMMRVYVPSTEDINHYRARVVAHPGDDIAYDLIAQELAGIPQDLPPVLLTQQKEYVARIGKILGTLEEHSPYTALELPQRHQYVRNALASLYTMPEHQLALLESLLMNADMIRINCTRKDLWDIRRSVGWIHLRDGKIYLVGYAQGD